MKEQQEAQEQISMSTYTQKQTVAAKNRKGFTVIYENKPIRVTLGSFGILARK